MLFYIDKMKIDPYKIKWFYGANRGKNHAALFIDAVGRLAIKNKYPRKLYNFPYEGKFYLQANGSRCITEEDHDGMIEVTEEILKERPDFFYTWGEKMEDIANDIREWTDNLKNKNWHQRTNEELFGIIYEHCDLQAKLWAVPLAYLYYFYFNDKIVEELIADLKQKLGNKFDDVLPSIVAQEKMSEIAMEKKELLELAIKEIRGDKIEKELKDHWKKFAYLNNYYYWGGGYSLADMEGRLKTEVEKGENTISEELEELKPKILDQSILDDAEKNIVRSMKKLSHAFQYNDETLAYAIHNIRGLYNESAKRLGLTYNQFVELTLPEIEASLRKKESTIAKADLDERFKDHVLIASGDESILFTGEECRRYVAHVFKEENNNVKEFKGSVVFKGGILQGEVHIISHADEISSFKHGEILVTAMTNPSFVPAMQKAKAIVTNDGGLLCHAAIVSRELKKPCIVGTKIATKVLKDGDEVEVDADNGIVKIIKKSDGQ